jgi:acyl carrier protein
MTDPKNVRSADEVRAWLAAEVAKRQAVAVETIDTSVPLANYALDSMEAISLAGELEDWLGIELESTLVWDYPTIDKLALHLATVLAGAHTRDRRDT